MAGVQALRERNAQFWAAAAPGWIRYAERQDVLGTPLGEAAITALAARPGEHILDVGCGCGGTTATLAGITGAAHGVDLSPAMVDAARRRYPPETGATFEVCDLDGVGTVAGGPFDGAYSRMCLMLLADPVAGCAAIRRSLRPGGRLAATVFRAPQDNPWLAAALLGAAPALGPLPALPLDDEPGPFAFADPGRARAVLSAAGFTDVAVEPVEVTLAVPDDPDGADSPDGVAAWLIEIGPAGAAYRAAPAADQAGARAGAAQLLRRFHTPGVGHRLPTGIWLLTGVAAD